MYVGSGAEFQACPKCGTELSQTRPVMGGPPSFHCPKCGVYLRFSNQGQKRFKYVILAVCVFGPAAILVRTLFGEGMGAIAAIVGALGALFVLVWQGNVPQLEIIDKGK